MLFLPRLIVNLNDLKDYLTNQVTSTIIDTSFDSIFCHLPTTNNKLPLKNKNTLNDNRQILEVADAETILNFITLCSREAKINLDIVIPDVLLYIPDKIFFQTLYNR